jgi:hypothetical protein
MEGIFNYTAGSGRMLREDNSIFNVADALQALTATATTQLTQANTYPYTFPKVMSSFVLKNDGAKDIVITINTKSWTIKSGEQFDEFVGNYTVVGITNTGNAAFRAFGRG